MLDRALLRCCLVITVMFPATAWSADEKHSEESLRELIIAAIGNIQTVECQYAALAPEKYPLKNTIKDSQGLVLSAEWHRIWDRSRNADFLETTKKLKFEEDTMVGRYEPWTYSFDGEIFYEIGVGHDAAGPYVFAGRKREPSNTWIYKGPLDLLGLGSAFEVPWGQIEPILSGLKLEMQGAQENGLYHMSTSYHMAYDPKAPEQEAHFWVDPQHGYLPSRVESRRKGPLGFTDVVCEVTRFHEVQKGTWFPVEGKITYFKIKEIRYPDGLTQEQVGKLSQSELEQRKIYERATVDVEMFPGNPIFFVTQPESVKVNHVIPLERFQPPFPPGARVHDWVLDKHYVMPGESAYLATLKTSAEAVTSPPDSPSSASPGFFSPSAGKLLVLAGIVLASLGVISRLLRRKPA